MAASPQVAPRPMTAEEFYELPEPEEGGKLELVDGEVTYEMPVNGEHGIVATTLIAELHAFVRKHKLGSVVPEVGFVVGRNPDTVLGPDVAFVATAAMVGGRLPKTGWVQHAPTLAIEVVSPSNLHAEIAMKVERYLAAGAIRVWVVQPKTGSVTVHLPDHTSRTLLAGSSLTSDDAAFSVAGFELPLDDLFGD